MAVPAGAAIAADAVTYAGQRYTYGGRADHPGDWDCSSFVSYVLGHDLGMVLPGGGSYGSPGYPPDAHGPVVVSWAGWAGATTLGKGQAPAAGDLCVWAGLGPLGHIGIALDARTMVSALDTAAGTVVTPIQGFGPVGVPVVFRRVNGAAQVPGQGPSSSADAWLALVGVSLAAGAVPLVMAAVVVGVAAAFGVGLLAAAAWLASRAAAP